MSIGVKFAMVAAAVLLRAATPPVPAVFVHLPANQVTIDDIHVEAADQGRLQLRGWMCRRAPGPSVAPEEEETPVPPQSSTPAGLSRE